MRPEEIQPSPVSAAPSGAGRLIVRVSTARGAIPLEGATVYVRNASPDGDGDAGKVIVCQRSGNGGSTPVITLPAPPRALSESVPEAGAPKPYAEYHLEVTYGGYFTATYLSVPIYDGITAIQPADLIPLPERSDFNRPSPDGRITDEDYPPLLGADVTEERS